MSDVIGSKDPLLRSNFLTVLHSLKFSNENEDVTEACQIERRCLAAQYMAAKKFNDEDTAHFIFKKGLKNYQRLMDDKTSVNNHLSRIQALAGKNVGQQDNWKSNLKDLKVALQFVKPLSCQTDNLKDCRKKEFTDRHVKDIVEAWKVEQPSSRFRKLSRQQNSSSSIESDELNLRASSTARQPVATTFYHKATEMPDKNCPIYTEYQKLTSMVSNGFDQRESIAERRFPNRSNSLLQHPESSNAPNKSNGRFVARDSGTNKVFETGESQIQHQYNDTSRYFKRNPMNQSKFDEPDDPRRRNTSAQPFRTASEELQVQQANKNQQAPRKRTGSALGGKVQVNRPFVCPFKRNDDTEESGTKEGTVCEDSRLKNIDAKMVELIKSEIMDCGAPVTWDDIAGLEFAKNTIKEIVVLPLLRPDIFTGLRRPPKGILLFGPPGTGKTLIGKCIASQSKSTFFSISASSLGSKWVGEGEKLVRALFAVARVYQPAVVFIDEIDSLLSKRSDSEHDSTRKVKTEFLVQLDGAATAEDDRILIVGATNRPHELDEAARRRLVKRLYVPLPEFDARKQIITNLLRSERHNVSPDQVNRVAELTDGYSGADMTNLCKEASMGPIRSIPLNEFENINPGDVRHVTVDDFMEALSYVRASVSKADLSVYVEWDGIYGTGTAQKYNG